MVIAAVEPSRVAISHEPIVRRRSTADVQVLELLAGVLAGVPDPRGLGALSPLTLSADVIRWSVADGRPPRDKGPDGGRPGVGQRRSRAVGDRRLDVTLAGGNTGLRGLMAFLLGSV